MNEAALAHAPDWIAELVEAPTDVVAALLASTLATRANDPGASVELLLDWLDWLESADIVAAVDSAAANWVAEQWGGAPDSQSEVVALARAWMLVADIAVQLEAADQLRAELRSRRDESRLYLGPLSVGPAQDPLGRYLGAIATQQPDRSLAPMWWTLLGFPDDVPIHHLRYGLAGVMGMPRVEAERGRFPREVAYALTTVAAGLEQAAGSARISSERGRRAIVRLAGRGLARYPKRSWWTQALDHEQLTPTVRDWLADIFPTLKGVEAGREDGDSMERKRPSVLDGAGQGDPTAGWLERSRDIRRRLRQPATRDRALDDAKDLIVEQRRHSEQTGESHQLVQSLCNFGNIIRRRRPALALDWAREAMAWEPWDHYGWALALRVTLERDGPEAALPFAFTAAIRLPETAELSHELGVTLRELLCLSQAEEVFREETELYSTNQLAARSALADTLLRRGRFDEAAATFADVLDREQDNSWALRGRALALRQLGRPDDAIALVAPYLDLSDGAVYLRAEYIKALQQAGRAEEAREAEKDARRKGLYPQEPPEYPVQGERLWHPIQDLETCRGQARLLRRAGQRAQGSMRDKLWDAADEVLNHAVAPRGRRGAVAAESVRLLTARGNVLDALERVRAALVEAPGNLNLIHAKAEVGVQSALRDPTFSPGRLNELRANYRRLVDLNTALRPVADLGEARVALALRDGAASEAAAERALKRLQEWAPGSHLPRHRIWWETTARAYVFGDVKARGLDTFRERVHANDRPLAQLEEEFVGRVAGNV